MKRVALAVALLIALIGSAWPDYRDGREAHEFSNYAAALRNFRPLAEQGLALAQFYLGVMYDFGQGVPQDYVQAHMWSNLAVSRLPPGKHRSLAVQNRAAVAAKMTPAQIAEAQRLARERARGVAAVSKVARATRTPC